MLDKNFSKLVRSQVTKYEHKAYFCKRCLNHFSTPEKLNEHIEVCKENSACKIEVPKPGETISFKNFKKSMRVPFVIYADFEAVTEKKIPQHQIQKNLILKNIKNILHQDFVIMLKKMVPKIMLNLLFTEVKIVWNNFLQ